MKYSIEDLVNKFNTYEDCIIYWVNGEGKTGTDLPEDDERYAAVMKHME